MKYEGDRIWNGVRRKFNIDVRYFSDELDFLSNTLALMAKRETKLPNLGDKGKLAVLQAALDWYAKETGKQIPVKPEQVVERKVKPIRELGLKAKTTTGKTYVLTREEYERIKRENKSLGRYVAGKLVGLQRKAISGLRALFGG